MQSVLDETIGKLIIVIRTMIVYVRIPHCFGLYPGHKMKGQFVLRRLLGKTCAEVGGVHTEACADARCCCRHLRLHSDFATDMYANFNGFTYICSCCM